MLPISRIKRQPILWPVNAEPPPWICMIPDTPGVFRIGAVPPPFIVSCPHLPSPLLQGVPPWQVSCDPFLPLMSVPSASDPAGHQFPLANGQWVGAHSPAFGFTPSSNVELIPLFPNVYTSTIPPAGKCWVGKKIPNCKIFLNNSFALESSWNHPTEEIVLFQGPDKLNCRTGQVTTAISRPSTASRCLHTVIVTPQRMTGNCQSGIKPASGTQAVSITGAVAAPPAVLMGIDSETSHRLSSASVPPYHMLTLPPIKVPFITSHLHGGPSRIEARVTPFLPAHFARFSTSPALTFMTTTLMDQTSNDNSKERNRPSCSTTLILRSERKDTTVKTDEKDNSVRLTNEEDCITKGNKPVASTPVPGSPWCVVWTGDDRVFFFNPTIQLSVWDKPTDLKNRVDINRIIEDPPHKRKLETSASCKRDGQLPEEINDEHITKTKRNKTEDPAVDQEDVSTEESTGKPAVLDSLPPLEERMKCFRNMLLERGVSAFSTWEKELHKIVFDPRYLLLNSEERKQMFEQFVKTRIKEEYKEKRSKLLLAKEEFKKLLEESKLSPRTTFKEFAEKYGRDQRFRVVQKRKDQEHFFNQFINLLKKRDKENRLRLRKMR